MWSRHPYAQVRAWLQVRRQTYFNISVGNTRTGAGKFHTSYLCRIIQTQMLQRVCMPFVAGLHALEWKTILFHIDLNVIKFSINSWWNCPHHLKMCEHITWYKKLRTAKYDPTKLEISLYRVVQNAFWITGTGELCIKSVTDGRTDRQTDRPNRC